MTTPYAVAAKPYLEAGWSPLPLPARNKHPVPTGFTGALGLYVTQVQLDAWLDGKAKAGKLLYRPGNVALRLPENVLGVDVDAYGEKAGESTLAAAEKAWGGLPRTWVATSREDGLSGIRLFRIPTGLAWPGGLPQGGGVDLLRWDHRFAVVAPSIHPEGRAYKWYKEGPDGTLVEVDDGIPEVDDLPTLPRRWVVGLTNRIKWEARPLNEEMDAEDIADWIGARRNPNGDPCSRMESTVNKFLPQIEKAAEAGGVHDAARDAAWALLGDAADGHEGITTALHQVRALFMDSVRARRSSAGEANAEWARLVHRGAQKVSARAVVEAEDPCSGEGWKPKREGRHGLSWASLDELGNATRLVDVMAGRARWVEAWGHWAIWSDTDRIWRRDIAGQVERWAVKAIVEMEKEVGYLEKEADIKMYKAHMKSSLNIGKQRAMIDMAKPRNGIIIGAEEFDADPRLLPVAGGRVVELQLKGIAERAARQSDYYTLATKAPFKTGTRHRLWDSFLRRFLPDEEVREWCQKLVGYSLLGINPARIMIFIIGPTSTGKTTFAEAIVDALGGLAGPMPASVLRDNTDDKPRPDLLAALPRRVVVAEEVSSAQRLHPDQIKRLTGGGLVVARGMRSNAYIQRVPAFTPWLVMNSHPTIDGADVALYRRLMAVPFNQQIKYGRERIDYRERLLTEAGSAVLAWCIEGYELYASDPESIWQIPAGAVEANNALREELSDVDKFLAECCERVEDAAVVPQALFARYLQWCDENEINSRDRVSQTKLGRELTAKGFDRKQVKVDGTPVWHRMGLRLR